MISFESVAALIGEPVRARMLWNMLDGNACTATELSIHAEVSAQSASAHLAKMVQAELIVVEKQGRHKYYRFARPEVAYAIEAIATLVPVKQGAHTQALVNDGVRFCRTCYDHLAGRAAVDLTRQLISNGILKPFDSHYEITRKGEKWFRKLNIDTKELKNQKRAFARKCLDWSERKHHLAGALGAALLQMMLTKKWVRKLPDSRVVVLTTNGRAAVYTLTGLLL